MNIGIEDSAAYLSRARECLKEADATNLRQRAIIQLHAAERWLRLAERARRIERAATGQESLAP